MREGLTSLLRRLGSGDRSALDSVMEAVYPELAAIAHHHLRGERASHTLATANLVNEAFLRFCSSGQLVFEDRAHFFGAASRSMRRILVDYARRRNAAKRDPGAAAADSSVTVAGDGHIVRVMDLDRLLELLHAEDAGLCQLVEMHYFGGMTAEEIGEAMGRTVHAVRHDLRLGQAWLRRAAGQPDAEKNRIRDSSVD